MQPAGVSLALTGCPHLEENCICICQFSTIWRAVPGNWGAKFPVFHIAEQEPWGALASCRPGNRARSPSVATSCTLGFGQGLQSTHSWKMSGFYMVVLIVSSVSTGIKQRVSFIQTYVSFYSLQELCWLCS